MVSRFQKRSLACGSAQPLPTAFPSIPKVGLARRAGRALAVSAKPPYLKFTFISFPCIPRIPWLNLLLSLRLSVPAGNLFFVFNGSPAAMGRKQADAGFRPYPNMDSWRACCTNQKPIPLLAHLRHGKCIAPACNAHNRQNGLMRLGRARNSAHNCPLTHAIHGVCVWVRP